ncbi:MAG: zinc-ribbon domain containing protein [Kofleriaceae bacterium]
MAKHPKTREQKKARASAKVAATKKVAAEGEETTVPIWYHPQFGVRIQDGAPSSWSRDGLPVVPWSVVARLDVIKRGTYSFTIIGGQLLPKGFLWGQPNKQKFGLSGPFLAYAPIHRRCRDCKAMFEWTAAAQRHLYETLGVYVDKTATRCQACARRRRAIEDARAAYAKTVEEIPADTAAPYVRVAKAMLELLEAGGTLSIDRAIGYCTRARKLGAGTSIDAIETKLRALR